MTQHKIETFSMDLEIRAGEIEQRIITARLAPYGEVSHLTEHPGGERFAPRAFARSVKHHGEARRPMLLFRAHDHTRAIGTTLGLKDSEAGPIGEFRIAQTGAGDEALAEVKAGLLPQVSIGFRSLRERMVDGVREVLEAAIHEVSLAPMGAYDGAEVLSLRTPAKDLAWISLPPAPEVDLSRLGGLRV